jgi:hypothetical protein
MTSENFIFWLNGFIELTDPKILDEKQIQIIKDHIALVLKKETPVRLSEKSQDILNRLQPTKITGPILPQFPSIVTC